MSPIVNASPIFSLRLCFVVSGPNSRSPIVSDPISIGSARTSRTLLFERISLFCSRIGLRDLLDARTLEPHLDLALFGLERRVSDVERLGEGVALAVRQLHSHGAVRDVEQ